MYYDVVLVEKNGEDGLTRAETAGLTEMVEEPFIPIELLAEKHESAAQGFIAAHAAEKLSLDYKGLEKFVASIMDDMAKETEDHVYRWSDLTIFLDRSLPKDAGKKSDMLLWDRLKEHLGHNVEIVAYGEPDDPEDICLEDIDTYEVVLDAQLYTLAARR